MSVRTRGATGCVPCRTTTSVEVEVEMEVEVELELELDIELEVGAANTFGTRFRKFVVRKLRKRSQSASVEFIPKLTLTAPVPGMKVIDDGEGVFQLTCYLVVDDVEGSIAAALPTSKEVLLHLVGTQSKLLLTRSDIAETARAKNYFVQFCQ